MDETQESEVAKLNENEPDFSKTGFWGVGALLPDHQMRLNALGHRYLAAIGPDAKTMETLLIKGLGVSNWTAVQSVIFDIVDSLTFDGEGDGQVREKFWFMLSRHGREILRSWEPSFCVRNCAWRLQEITNS